MLSEVKKNQLDAEAAADIIRFWTEADLEGRNDGTTDESKPYNPEIKWVAGNRSMRSKGAYVLFIQGEGVGTLVACDNCGSTFEWLDGNCTDYQMGEGGRCDHCFYPSDKKAN